MAENEPVEPQDQEPSDPPESPETPPAPEADTAVLQQELAKWKSLSRKHEASSKQNAEAARKLKELEDAQKSEAQRLQDAVEELKGRAGTAEAGYRKLQAALDKAPEWADLKQVRAVAKRLSGDTDDDLATDADELYELLAPQPADAEPKPELPRKPREALRGGGDPDEEPEETDPSKLAALIPRH